MFPGNRRLHPLNVKGRERMNGNLRLPVPGNVHGSDIGNGNDHPSRKGVKREQQRKRRKERGRKRKREKIERDREERMTFGNDTNGQSGHQFL